MNRMEQNLIIPEINSLQNLNTNQNNNLINPAYNNNFFNLQMIIPYNSNPFINNNNNNYGNLYNSQNINSINNNNYSNPFLNKINHNLERKNINNYKGNVKPNIINLPINNNNSVN